MMDNNIKYLLETDVLLVSYLCAGSSLIGSLLLELGINYVEAYQEKLLRNSNKTTVVNPSWREHWPQLANKYTDKIFDNKVRVIKTHYYPESFSETNIKKVILLVRDPRDVVISYYYWRINFSDETGTLHNFLEKKGFYSKRPFDDWSCYIEEWLKTRYKYNICVVRYEDLKFKPLKVAKKLLKFLEVKVSRVCIKQAIKNSKFSKLHNEEKNILSDVNKKLIFRRGLIGEWREKLDARSMNLITNKTLFYMKKLKYSDNNVPIGNGTELRFVNINKITIWSLFLALLYGTKSIAIVDNSKISREDIDKNNCFFNTKDIGRLKVTCISNKVKTFFPGVTLIVIIKQFDVLHLDNFINGNTIVASDNEDIVKAIDYRCMIGGWRSSSYLITNNETALDFIYEGFKLFHIMIL